MFFCVKFSAKMAMKSKELQKVVKRCFQRNFSKHVNWNGENMVKGERSNCEQKSFSSSFSKWISGDSITHTYTYTYVILLSTLFLYWYGLKLSDWVSFALSVFVCPSCECRACVCVYSSVYCLMICVCVLKMMRSCCKFISDWTKWFYKYN